MHNLKSETELNINIDKAAKYHLVLLIDDNRTDNFIARNTVRNCSFSEFINIYTNAQLALDFLRSIQAGTSIESAVAPDYIFLDLNMPIMNGFEFMAEFETLDMDFRKGIKIVMLTSSVSQHDRSTAEKYSCLHKFINKPMTEKALEKL
jgi:CheY-like chemotaxis protein